MGKMFNSWRGCSEISMRYYNDWSDPDLIYHGYVFNYWDIENAMWEDFKESERYQECLVDETITDEAFSVYCQEFAPDYLNELIVSEYFSGDSKTWHGVAV